MALLERITSMYQQGATETQIINTLSEEGLAPLEINEAISQLKIKAAVSQKDYNMQPSVMAQNSDSQYASIPQAQQNQPTYASAPAYPPQMQQAYPPEQYQYPAQTQQYATEQNQGQAYPEQQYAPEGTYYQQATDVETIRDIAKQVVEESLQKMREELSSLSKMKSDVNFEMQDIENRLKKIESIIQELQTSIIRRMGQYGESIEGISKEVQATQESFAKMVNPIMDKKRNLQSEEVETEIESREEQEEQIEPIEQKRQSKQTQTKPSSRSASQSQVGSRTSSDSGVSFEDYFR